jgi:hypothetical protein
LAVNVVRPWQSLMLIDASVIDPVAFIPLIVPLIVVGWFDACGGWIEAENRPLESSLSAGKEVESMITSMMRLPGHVSMIVNAMRDTLPLATENVIFLFCLVDPL